MSNRNIEENSAIHEEVIRTLNPIFDVPRSLEYSRVDQNLLMVDELPQGAIERYERDVRQTAHILNIGTDRSSETNNNQTDSSHSDRLTQILDEIQEEVDRNIVNSLFNVVPSETPRFTIQFANPPLFDIIGFNTSNENKFDVPVKDSVFSIYVVKCQQKK